MYRAERCVLFANAFLLIKFIPFPSKFRVSSATETSKFKGPTWGPHGSCRSEMCPMLAPWICYQGSREATLLSLIRWVWFLTSISLVTSEFMLVGILRKCRLLLPTTKLAIARHNEITKSAVVFPKCLPILLFVRDHARIMPSYLRSRYNQLSQKRLVWNFTTVMELNEI